MQTKEIKSFTVSASLTHDVTRIDLVFVDGTTYTINKLSPLRFSAALAVLQATPRAFYFLDSSTGQHIISSSSDTPGTI